MKSFLVQTSFSVMMSPFKNCNLLAYSSNTSFSGCTGPFLNSASCSSRVAMYQYFESIFVTCTTQMLIYMQAYFLKSPFSMSTTVCHRFALFQETNEIRFQTSACHFHCYFLSCLYQRSHVNPSRHKNHNNLLLPALSGE